jgi:maleate cis-trans isomerase
MRCQVVIRSCKLKRDRQYNLTGQEISNFISSCQNLNCEKVVDLLNNQLKQPVVFVNIYYFIDFVEMFSVIMTKTLL